MSKKPTLSPFAVVPILGTLGILSTLWLPWALLDAEVVAERNGIEFPTSENPGANQAMKQLMGIFAQVETGTTGALNLGIVVPSWVFIFCVFVGGILSVLAWFERIFIGRLTLLVAILLPSTVLGVWIWQQLNIGAVIQSGPFVAAFSIGLIVYSVIKIRTVDSPSRQPVNLPSRHSSRTSGGPML